MNFRLNPTYGFGRCELKNFNMTVMVAIFETERKNLSISDQEEITFKTKSKMAVMGTIWNI